MINGKELVEQEERGNREMNIEEWRPWRRINRNEERLNEVFQNLYGSPFLNFANFRIVRSGLRRSRLLSGHEGSGGGNGGGNSNVRRRSDEEKKRTEEGRLRFFSSSNTLQRQYSRLNGGEENEDSRESSIASGSSVKGSPPGFSATNNINTETGKFELDTFSNK
ncbi:hypothetical protein AX774_g6 [Zancudomyces culisetae]|uniref:Uncharacterized protein n=1 Tax=Zancudomyces culisetae TaxID=1213189 RepID=A0A1R1PZN2_ZANCU|nr:hypothetical protein AX774_g6 [Zancudomyces culisetae]|eukprot:OMH86418.1 hypothetical protein AX774_g6 [Zancudomyces culisetae]